MNLVAGQQYYIEAFSKEGGGGDNLSVAWSGPSIARQVIPSDVLHADQRRLRRLVPERARRADQRAAAVLHGRQVPRRERREPRRPGRAVIQYDCHGSTNQRWTLTAGGAMQVYGNRCLTPLAGLIATGTPVVIDNCTISPAQTWAYTAGTLRVGGLCLEVTGANPNNGAPIQIATCNGAAAQNWTWAA